MEENRDVWELWQYAGGQWRIGGMGVPIGLDLPAVKIVADALDIALDEYEMAKIKCLEAQDLCSYSEADPDRKIREYCKSCQDAKRNIKCAECDLSTVK